MTVEPEYVQTNHEGEEITDEERQTLMQNKVRPDNFTKINWKSGEARDRWQDLHDGMQEAKYEAEWRSVISDKTDRKAAIIHVNNFNREKWLRRVGEHNLHYRDIRHTTYDEGFSHEFNEVDPQDPERVTYAVIAENPDVADKMEEAETEMGGFERHNTVGGLLGFPECGREFFWDVWGVSDDTDRWVDPMYEIAANTDSAVAIDGDRQNIRIEDPIPAVNALYRYWGFSFITHMPCSFDCEHSKEIAEARGDIMAENGYADEANAMLNWMSRPMVWEARLGIAHVRNEDWIGSANSSGYFGMKRIVWGEEHEGGSVV